MVVPPRYGVTLTGSDNGYYSEVPKCSGSQASDNANSELLQSAESLLGLNLWHSQLLISFTSAPIDEFLSLFFD